MGHRSGGSDEGRGWLGEDGAAVGDRGSADAAVNNRHARPGVPGHDALHGSVSAEGEGVGGTGRALVLQQTGFGDSPSPPKGEAPRHSESQLLLRPKCGFLHASVARGSGRRPGWGPKAQGERGGASRSRGDTDTAGAGTGDPGEGGGGTREWKMMKRGARGGRGVGPGVSSRAEGPWSRCRGQTNGVAEEDVASWGTDAIGELWMSPAAGGSCPPQSDLSLGRWQRRPGTGCGSHRGLHRGRRPRKSQHDVSHAARDHTPPRVGIRRQAGRVGRPCVRAIGHARGRNEPAPAGHPLRILRMSPSIVGARTRRRGGAHEGHED